MHGRQVAPSEVTAVAGATTLLIMSVVKINAIEVPEGMGAELEKRFAARAGQVDQEPGFEEFMLLRPIAGDNRYFVLTRWESEEAFQNWRNGQAFQRQHTETHEDQGGGKAKPQHPVATDASLLEFEVVSLSTPPADSKGNPQAG